MNSEFDIENEKKVKKAKRNIRILLIFAIIIISIPIYIIIKSPFGIMYISAYGNSIQQNKEEEKNTEFQYNPAKEELQKQLNNYIVTYNIMQKGAKDFEEIQKYIDKENKLKALQERLEKTEKEDEIQNIKSEFESIIDF